MRTATDHAAGRAMMLAACSFWLACSSAPSKPTEIAPGDYSYTRARLTWLIEGLMRNEQVTGLSIALVDGDQIAWTQGFGWADAEAGAPVTASTLFRIGSITKLFTATAVMQLVEQGKVDLDEPLLRYLPELRLHSRFPGTRPFTVREVLTHHAGLPSNYLPRSLTPDPPPIQWIVGALEGQDLTFPPGEVWAYSNVGFELLGALIERVSGLPYAEYMQRNLLDPLGMRSATFDQDLAHLPGLSKGYRDGEPRPLYPLRLVSAGGLNANAAELALFLQMVIAGGSARGGQILAPETLAEMLRRQNARVPLDLDLAQGLGYMLDTASLRYAGSSASHTGGIVCFRSTAIVMPELGLGVVVLANSSNGDKSDLLGRVAVEAMRLALEAKHGIEPPEPSKRLPPGVPTPAFELRELAGDWATVAGPVSLEPEGEGLVARVLDRPLEMVRRPDGSFSLRYRLLGPITITPGPLKRIALGFPRVGEQRVLAARYKGAWLLAGSRLARYPISDAWRRRLGSYEITNLGKDYPLLDEIRLVEKHGLLQLEAKETPYPDLPETGQALRPLSDEAAVIEGLAGIGQIMGLTLRVVPEGDSELLELAGYRLRKRSAR